MLEAYFDDSGNGGGPVLVLAGWPSTAERWASFNEQWRAVLDEKPEIEPFKMQRAMTWGGAWRRMTWDERGELLGRFHSIITKHIIRSFACVVHRDAFDELTRKGFEAPATAYQLAFMGVIQQTIHYHQEAGVTDKVDFVFDEQKHDFERARAAFVQWRRNNPYVQRFVAGTPREANDRDVLPLQAADYLAWQIRRKIVSMQSGTPERRPLVVRSPDEYPRTDPQLAPNAVPAGYTPLVMDEWDRERLQRTFNPEASGVSKISGPPPIDLA